MACGLQTIEDGVKKETGAEQAFMTHPIFGCLTCCPSNIGTGMPNCYVCASIMSIGQFVPLDQHVALSSLHVVRTHVHEC